MRKLTVLLIALASAFVLGIAPAGAVTDGELDGNRHPHVGLMVAIGDVTLPNGTVVQNVPLWRCSGTAMSSTVYLTAGHCTEAPAEHVEIWFSPGQIWVTFTVELYAAYSVSVPIWSRCGRQ